MQKAHKWIQFRMVCGGYMACPTREIIEKMTILVTAAGFTTALRRRAHSRPIISWVKSEPVARI